MKAEWLVCIALPKELQTGDGGGETKVSVRKASWAAIRARRWQPSKLTRELEGGQT